MKFNKTNNQFGFSTLETILLIVILAIIGGTGYYVYSANKSTNNTYTSTKSSKTNSSKDSSSIATKYLVFKEWGVRMTLNENMSDAYYEFNPNDTSSAYLSVQSLVDLAPACAPLGTSIGAIFRQSIAEYQSAIADPNDINAPGNIKIGDYYYGFIGAQAGCFEDTNIAAQSLYDSVQPRSGFVTAEKTLEAVPAN